MPAFDRWKYQVTTLRAGLSGAVSEKDLQEALDRLGAQGWELVQLMQQGTAFGRLTLVFKRPG